jgi:hypothetical protein|tara:strand:- start:4108 stop:4257 length:150 start_codon:yes stop_codon:yes gene_type:complete
MTRVGTRAPRRDAVVFTPRPATRRPTDVAVVVLVVVADASACGISILRA